MSAGPSRLVRLPSGPEHGAKRPKESPAPSGPDQAAPPDSAEAHEVANPAPPTAPADGPTQAPGGGPSLTESAAESPEAIDALDEAIAAEADRLLDDDEPGDSLLEASVAPVEPGAPPAVEIPAEAPPTKDASEESGETKSKGPASEHSSRGSGNRVPPTKDDRTALPQPNPDEGGAAMTADPMVAQGIDKLEADDALASSGSETREIVEVFRPGMVLTDPTTSQEAAVSRPCAVSPWPQRFRRMADLALRLLCRMNRPWRMLSPEWQQAIMPLAAASAVMGAAAFIIALARMF